MEILAFFSKTAALLVERAGTFWHWELLPALEVSKGTVGHWTRSFVEEESAHDALVSGNVGSAGRCPTRGRA